MKLLFEIEQNTDEWIAYKLGKFSASSAAELLMDKKTKGYNDLIERIIEERITGNQSESRWNGNQFTERGHELEHVGIEHFELNTFKDVVRVGCIEHDEFTLCSPDGLIEDDGLIQIKCPIFKTQLEYLRTKKVPGNYYKQMQFELFVSNRDYNIFYSYHPYLPPVSITVERDESMIADIQIRLEEAKKEVLEQIEIIKSL